jgi:hypothetical protein
METKIMSTEIQWLSFIGITIVWISVIATIITIIIRFSEKDNLIINPREWRNEDEP